MNTQGQGAVVKTAQGAKAASPAVLIKDYMEKAKGALASALPRHLNPDRFLRLFLVAVNQNPKLLQCTKESLLGVAMSSAQLGLEPGPLGQVYLIPYNSKNGMQVQFQVGYKGVIDLVMRTGQVDKLAAYEVCQNDVFDYELGYNERLVHKPAEGDRGPEIKYYAYAVLKSGAKFMAVLTKDDAEKHAKRYSQAYSRDQETPWKSAFGEMAKKTALLKLMKYLPKSVELVEMTAHDPQLRAEIMPDASDFIPTEPPEIMPEEPEETKAPEAPPPAQSAQAPRITSAGAPAAPSPTPTTEATPAMGLI